MNTDIRILTTFRNNRKRRKLDFALKENATGYLIDLWIGAAISRPDGKLIGWDAVDIALEANYPGDPVKFTTALIDSGFLCTDGDIFFLKNWKEKQKWAAAERERSLSASKKAIRRWVLKELNKKDHAEFNKWFDTVYAHSIENNAISIATAYAQHKHSINSAEHEHSFSNAGGNAPLPLPSPYPKEVKDICIEKENAVENEEPFYLSKKKKKLTGQKMTDFFIFWKVFSYPKGKAEAADSWMEIYKPERMEEILRGAKAEAAKRPEIIANGRTPKMAQGWLSGRRWEDEESVFNCDTCDYKLNYETTCWQEGRTECEAYRKAR